MHDSESFRRFRDEVILPSIAQSESELAILEAKLANLRKQNELLEEQLGIRTRAPNDPIRTTRATRSPQKPASRRARIQQILRQTGKPLHTIEIMRRLRDMGDGQGVDDKSFRRNIDAELRRSTRHFVKVATATWAALDRKEA